MNEKDKPKYSENQIGNVFDGVIEAGKEMRQKLHIMEVQRDRAIEIALDCLNGRMGTEEILALADLIEAKKPSN